MNDEIHDLLSTAIDASIRAGVEILEVYESADFEVEAKDDKSPLTLADRRSHDTIIARLNDAKEPSKRAKHRQRVEIPVLSEEGGDIAYEERSSWDRFWLVDPLDGTKEFIKRNGEFTVNIALIENGDPVLGVVYVPVTGALYFSAPGVGAMKTGIDASEYRGNEGGLDLDTILEKARTLPIDGAAGENGRDTDREKTRPVRVVASRSHFSEETADFINDLESRFGAVETVSAGSSIKICLVAEGSADVYPRFGPTMEWDVAAGHAVAAHAGCCVVRTDTTEALAYNKRDLLNPWFIVGRAPYV